MIWLKGCLLAGLALGIAGCGAGAAGKQQETPRLPKPAPIPAPPPKVKMEVPAALRDAAKQELAAALRSHDEAVRSHAVEGLKDSLGTEARADLLKALLDPEAIVRFAASMSCGELRIEQARPILLQM